VQDTAPGGLSLGYQFDEVGNLKWLRDGDQADPPLRVYGYDALSRLTSAQDGTTNAVLQAYAYDATGNRTSRTLGASAQTYTYGTTDHKLQGVAGVTRAYDAMGNTTAIGGTTKEFVYNQAGRMSAVKAGGVQTASYGYNGRGERVSKTAGSQTVLTLYTPDGRWLGDYGATGQPLQQMVWFGDLPVGLLTGAGAGQKLHYVEPDALGSPRVVIDPVRNVTVWRWELAGEAFGDTAPVQDPDGDSVAFVFDMRFPGQRYDSATGMNYNYFRDYDPATGRYLESDPIGLSGGIATYVYAESMPNNSMDRLGLSPLDGVGVTNAKDSCDLCAPGRKRFDNRTSAAQTVLAAVYLMSKNKNIEICGQLCRDNKTRKFFIGQATLGNGTTCNPWDKMCPSCSKSAGWWHTHGAPDGPYSEQFSVGRESDVSITNWAAGIVKDPDFTGFLGTPNGFLISYSANSAIGPINRGALK